MSAALHELGVGELLDAYAARACSPVEVLDACLSRIDDLAPLGAVVTTAVDDARDAARASEQRWARGDARPLDGVPFGVKDIIATAGVRTTLGSARYADTVPTRDASCVAALRDAGAVMVGKLATPEFAFGDAREGHRPVNPWAPEHWTGGSSSGSAVALAARLLPLALGTDTGGSIRVPSSYCGVTGLKPTNGRLPLDGVGTVSWTLDHVGPMARSASDVARAFAVLAGDTTNERERPPTGAPGRVGVPRAWFAPCDPDVARATDDAVAVLDSLGATTVEVDMPDPELAAIAAWTITVVEFAEVHADWRDHVGSYTPAAAERLAAGSALVASDYVRARRVRRQLQARVEALFDDVDVLVTPATPTAALRLAPVPDARFGDGDRMWLEWVARYLIPFNLLGFPALVVPAGVSPDGRPLAVQLVGRPGAERAVLTAAELFQRATEHHRSAPDTGSFAVGAAA
jgi:aspartyl-tRNA(Asn)/glutamyl-tRNA(Gln) amidotransferase subunit A